MIKWYALVCTKDRKDYKTGEVCSYTTVLPGKLPDDVEVVDCGLHDGWIDFSTKYFDTETKSLISI